MLSKKTTRWAAALALPVIAAAALAGDRAAGQGVAAKAGQALDNTGRSIRNGFQSAFSKSRESVHEQEVLSRVYSRIHWDKMLVGSTVEIDAAEGGTITLRGAVPDAAAKKRAVILARDTVDVTSVVDDLTIAAPVSATPPPVATRPVPVATRPAPRTTTETNSSTIISKPEPDPR